MDLNKTYIGVVIDVNDPDKMGRVKIRVMGVYEEYPEDDIPWANPWKDLSGGEFDIPEKGKVVTVVFDNEERPEFIYANNYNINLENKLKTLSEDGYLSFKSLIFDHKTQIYVNDDEGLKIDYKYNNINLKEESIDINLKDNNTTLNLGDQTADQQAILGNHFFDWLDKFLDNLQTGLLAAGSPVLVAPNLMKDILDFKILKDLKYLSHHVNIVDNNKITTVRNTKRENDSQYGDNWTSTVWENNLTENKKDNFNPSNDMNSKFEEDTTESNVPKQTYSDDTYEVWSNVLFNALDRVDINIDPIHLIFNEMKNNSDVIKLTDTFGYKKGNVKTILSEPLVEWLNKTSMIEYVNSILNELNISYRY